MTDHTDRELLELAAKAAGISLSWGSKYMVGDDEVDCTDMPYMQYDHPGIADSYWNPLEDGGHALTLAVDLGLSIRIDKHAGFTWIKGFEGSTPHGSEPYAATRRTIVRAAAAIGEAMKDKQP